MDSRTVENLIEEARGMVKDGGKTSEAVSTVLTGVDINDLVIVDRPGLTELFWQGFNVELNKLSAIDRTLPEASNGSQADTGLGQGTVRPQYGKRERLRLYRLKTVQYFVPGKGNVYLIDMSADDLRSAASSLHGKANGMVARAAWMEKAAAELEERSKTRVGDLPKDRLTYLEGVLP